MKCSSVVEANFKKSAKALTPRILNKLPFSLIVCALALGLSPAIYGQAAGSFLGNVLDKSGSGCCWSHGYGHLSGNRPGAHSKD